MPFQQNKSSIPLWFRVNLLNGIVFLTFMQYPSTWKILVWVLWNFKWRKSKLAHVQDEQAISGISWMGVVRGRNKRGADVIPKGQHLKNMFKGREGVQKKEEATMNITHHCLV